MSEKLILFLLSFLFSLGAAAQANDVQPEMADLTTNDGKLLHEVQIIRGLQEDRRVGENKELKKIAENTDHDWVFDDWNFYGLATIILAFFAYLYTKWTYDAQMKTEAHTTNAPVEVQLWKLKDLPRHFYRNLVCTCAIILKNGPMKEGTKRELYPSESNLRKLQTLADDIILPIDVDKEKEADKNAYRYMHELKLLFRNYNIEVEVASEHLARPAITLESLKQDYDNLLFKPIKLTRDTFDYELALPVASEGRLVERTILTMLAEHFRKLEIRSNFDSLFKPECAEFLSTLLAGNIAETFKSNIDRKGSLDRSVNNLLDFCYKVKKGETEKTMKDTEVSDLMDVERKDAGGYEAVIDRQKAVEMLKEEALKTETELKLTLIDGTDTYPAIAPYIDYLRQEKWELHTLLKYMLAIDATIETNRIGMVNFS